jgi:ferredoxin--NADP+ reductase
LYRIIKKVRFSDSVNLVEVEAPPIARKARPGQFVMVRTDEQGERIPFTIADFAPQAGSITLIFQVVG